MPNPVSHFISNHQKPFMAVGSGTAVAGSVAAVGGVFFLIITAISPHSSLGVVGNAYTIAAALGGSTILISTGLGTIIVSLLSKKPKTILRIINNMDDTPEALTEDEDLNQALHNLSKARHKFDSTKTETYQDLIDAANELANLIVEDTEEEKLKTIREKASNIATFLTALKQSKGRGDCRHIYRLLDDIILAVRGKTRPTED